MIQDAFEKVYAKFKIYFYQKAFEKWKGRETTLTTVETFCMEIIYSMGTPTINEFAKVANISSPNAAYKVNNLIKKGYVRKVQSQSDKREYHLEVTEKYLNYYNISHTYLEIVMERIKKRFSKEELAVMEKILVVMNEELMPEINI